MDNQKASVSSKGFFQLQPNQTYSESASHALLGLFFYSCLMFTIPLLIFFGSRQVLEDYFSVEPPYSQLAPVIFAVLAVNVIIVAYVVKAFREEARERPQQPETMEERKKKE